MVQRFFQKILIERERIENYSKFQRNMYIISHCLGNNFNKCGYTSKHVDMCALYRFMDVYTGLQTHLENIPNFVKYLVCYGHTGGIKVLSHSNL